MSPRFLFIILFIISIQQPVFATETVRFKIWKGNDHIGDIHAKKESINTQNTYTITSKASFWVFFKYVRETIMKVAYLGEHLESSDSQQNMNKELKAHKTTVKKESGYLCENILEKEQFNIYNSITFSSCMLYFNEPKGLTHIYAESYQELCPITLINPGIYKLELPQGKINHYVYKNGVLEEIRVFRTMVDLTFKRSS